MDFIITFCGSVAASMISHYLCLSVKFYSVGKFFQKQ